MLLEKKIIFSLFALKTDNSLFCHRDVPTIKLMKGKALRKHSLHEKTAASVLLKLFISSNELCHTTDAP